MDIEAIRAMTELARHGHRALLAQQVADLPRPERPQHARDPARAAAALEAHRRAAEEPQVRPGKARASSVLRAAR